MPEVNPTANTQRFNHILYEAAEDAGVRSAKIKPEMGDPSRREVEQAQKQDIGANAIDLGFGGALEVGTYIVGGLGVAAGAAGIIVTAYDLAKGYFEAHEQGEDLANARARDAMHLSVLSVGSSELPEGFVQRRAYALRESAYGANHILTKLHTSGDYEAYKAATNAFIQQGKDAAHARGIHDAESLARARKDPAFEANYRHNPAFRLGVDAVVYQATQKVQTQT
jgi:hypothetical protein